MGYRFENYCVDTVTELYALISANCPTVATDGSLTIKCEPLADSINIITDTIPSANNPVTTNYIPSLIECNTAPRLAEIAEYAWAIAAIWLTAWGVRELYRIIARRS